ncbi:MAG: GTA-gp10 family protein [Asticcacaulis sp.]
MPPNAARGEVTATLGGHDVRLCVTLGALAAMESHFNVSCFPELSQCLTALSAKDLTVILRALVIDEADISAASLPEAIDAVVRAFGAMNE